MSQGSLETIFAPRSIAVVGASDRIESVGGSIFANLIKASFAGDFFPINRQHPIVQGHTAYKSIRELPSVPDLAVLCTSAETIPDLVGECGEAGVGGLVVISAGFREAGAAGVELENRLKAKLADYPQMRMIGPNCLGILRPSHKLNASFSPVLPRPGRTTLLTQSGALGTAIMDWSMKREIGFASCVSVGNMTNVGMGELIEHFANDDETEAVLLYLEGLTEGRHFVEAARACSLRKPVIAYKAGRFAESSKAAASHTGAMASQDAVYEAAFRRAGIERVHSIEELFDCASLLAGERHTMGNRLAIVTNAGGPGIMATDAWLALQGSLAELTGETKAALSQALPPCWSHGNPIDVLGDASVDRFQTAIRLALADPNVDAVMVIVTPQTMTEPLQIARATVQAQNESGKTIVASWIGGPSVELGREVLREAGVPVYDFPEAAANALHHVVSYGLRRSALVSSVKPQLAEPPSLVTQEQISFWRDWLKCNPGLIDEVHSKTLLSEFGIPTVPTQVAYSPDEAVAIAKQMGFPVALKVLSPDISHKTDVGGVVLNVASEERVRASYKAIQESVEKLVPQARWGGVSVQPMVSATRGIELLLGMKRDPLFGPIILLGAGGITAELQKDSILELTPVDDLTCEQMLRSLRLYPLLEGYRGRPGVHLPALRQAVTRFVQMVTALPELSAAEINPLTATPEGVIALDARLICS